jgi:phosphoribosyl 1,2-cyclic phosphodiesterase
VIEFRTIASSSAGCCYVVSGGGIEKPLMVECGLPIAQIRVALGFPLSWLAGCLVSHSHQDHCKAAKALTSAGINIFASRPTIDAIATDRPYRTCELIPGDEWQQVGEWQVLPFEVNHDCPGTLGFVIASKQGDRLLFMTDTCYSRFRFEGLTMVAVEYNHSEELLRSNVDRDVISGDRFRRTYSTHFSIERLERFLDACDLSKVTKMHLLHLSDSNSDEVAFKSRIERRYGIPVEIAKR